MWLTTLAVSDPEGGRTGLSPLSEMETCLQNVTDILRVRGQRTVQECKVKGHATEDMVARGRVQQADLEGNNRADETADLWQKKAG